MINSGPDHREQIWDRSI